MLSDLSSITPSVRRDQNHVRGFEVNVPSDWFFYG